MMESPIDERLWKYMFHSAAVCLTGGVLFSLWRQSRAPQRRLNKTLSGIAAKNDESREEALKDVYRLLEEETAAKKGAPHLSVQHNLKYFVDQLKYDGSNAGPALLALKIIKKYCAGDAVGRYAFYRAGGYRKMMAVLSEAHRHGHTALMEEAAATLESLTATEESDIVLPADVPFGSEGACSLAQFPSTPKMLRTLDPSARVAFLVRITGLFANLSSLLVGARALQKGIDGSSGAFFFLRLLNHSTDTVIENSARTLRNLALNGDSQHQELSQPESVKRIVALLSRASSVQLPLLLLIRSMVDSPKASVFFEQFVGADGIVALFRLWVVGLDKQVRDSAESIVHTLDGVECTSKHVKRLMEVNRSNILERKARDEEAKRKHMQQMKQQQMLNQMMLQEMLGGSGQDLAAMMGEE